MTTHTCSTCHAPRAPAQGEECDTCWAAKLRHWADTDAKTAHELVELDAARDARIEAVCLGRTDAALLCVSDAYDTWAWNDVYHSVEAFLADAEEHDERPMLFREPGGEYREWIADGPDTSAGHWETVLVPVRRRALMLARLARAWETDDTGDLHEYLASNSAGPAEAKEVLQLLHDYPAATGSHGRTRVVVGAEALDYATRHDLCLNACRSRTEQPAYLISRRAAEDVDVCRLWLRRLV